MVGSENPRNKNNFYYIVKSILFKITAIRRKDQILMFNMNVVAALMQLSGLFILIFTDFLAYSKWKTIVAIFLVSLSLFFNYFSFNSTKHSRCKLKNLLIDHLKRSKHNIDLTRQKIGLITNPWKIGLIFMFCYAFYPQEQFKFWLFDQQILEKDSVVYFYPLAVQVVSSIVCFLSSSLAYKLRMNRFSFALPIALVTPLSIVISVLICELRKPNLIANNWMDLFSGHFICTSKIVGYKWQLIWGLCLWWVSNIWSGSHVWSTEGANRLKNVKRIFKFQNFNSVFAENSLMFNYPPKNQDQAALEDSESEQDLYIGKSTLFICATMWHENENEMLQLLKSIMR